MIRFRNATIVEFDPPRIREGMDVYVDRDEIVRVGATSASTRVELDRDIDVTGKLLFPGLVCSHHHYYSGLARGVIADLGPMPDFVSILRELWWRMDRAHDEATLYASSRICSVDAIRSGTTAVIDHNASPNCITGSSATLRRGMEEVGLRGAVCYEVTDRNGEAGMEEGIEENRAYAHQIDAERKDGTWSGLSEAFIGGHAPFTLPDRALTAIGHVCESTGRGFHVHLAEGSYDVSYSHIHYRTDLVTRLDRFGLVTDRSLFAHGIYLNDAEIALMNERDAFLVHNCASNMNNNVGYNTRLADYTNVVLGTDGIGGDMFETTRNAFFKHRDSGGPLQPDGFLQALAAGNRLLERTFQRKFGRVEPGYVADVVIGNYRSPTPLVAENIAGHIAFGMGSNIVETVMIGGAIVMEDRRFPFDEEAIYANARDEARRLWSRMNEIEP